MRPAVVLLTGAAIAALTLGPVLAQAPPQSPDPGPVEDRTGGVVEMMGCPGAAAPTSPEQGG